MNRTAAGIIAASVGVGVWGWLADGHIIEKSAQDNRNATKSPTGPVAGSRDTRTQSSNEPIVASEILAASEIWTRRLQSGFQTKSSSSVKEPMASAVAPRPNVVIPQRSATPDVGLRLVGTVIEQGRSIAIAIDRAGKLDFCREGDSLQLEPEGVRVETVSDNSVRVSFKGHASTWLMGQSLRLESEQPNQPQGASPRFSTEMVTPTESRNQPKMGLEEELELINGVQPSVPL